jgi:hypothetical protein
MTTSRERTVVLLAVVVITVFRSAMFVFQAPLDFDSDQAIVGLMAKHLSQGRAFPLFYYGHNYMLAVEAWLVAPFFLLAGVSVATLKLPLLGMNLAIGLLLVVLFERELGLRPFLAFVASLFFVAAPPATSAVLLRAAGGNIEPLLYVLLLWLARGRPVWFGLIASIGFLQREFTIYAVAAIVLIELATRSAWLQLRSWRWLLGAARVAAEVWLVVQLLRPIASAAGPGTTVANLARTPSNGFIEAFRRFCFDSHAVVTGLQRLVTVHWSELFGTAVRSASSFGIESQTTQGLSWSGPVLGLAMLFAAIRCAMQLRTATPLANGRWRFCAYLIFVGALSAGVYGLGRCGDVTLMRYDLLSLLGACGLIAWFFAVEPSRRARQVVAAVVIGWAIVSATAHLRIWREYMSRPPLAAKTLVIRALDARHARYGRSDYWIAYYVSFMTNERIIMGSDQVSRILEYEDLVDTHREEAIRVSRTPCGDGRPAWEGGVYLCPL